MAKIDGILLVLVASLTLFGLLMIYEASSFIAFRDFGDKYHYLKDQTLWILIGFCALAFFTFFDYHNLYYLSLPILLVALFLLLLVFVPGVGVYVMGARRWVSFGSFVVQPAEFVKLGLAIYLAAWYSYKEKGRLTAFLLLISTVFLLIILQPDMGTAAIVIAEALSIYFLSGGSLLAFAGIVPAIAALAFILIKIEPYRAARLATFLDPSKGVLTSSYHVKQILIALGTGGLTGVGLGNSLQKFAYLPENTTDSIFAIIAEEFGFIGASFLVLALAGVVWRGFSISAHAKDKFGKLLSCGIITFLGTQMIINLGAQSALIPLTGVPLPFISYGGSALIVDLAAIGILLNISQQGQHV